MKSKGIIFKRKMAGKGPFSIGFTLLMLSSGGWDTS